jgi:hypothetical protein
MDEWSTATILPIAQRIARHMPSGWSAVAPDDHDNGAYLDGPDGGRLQITHIPNYGGSGNRFEIDGRPTREESRRASSYRDNKNFPGARKGITVAASKTPAQIARDITNRLLPAYLPYLTELRARVNADNANEDKITAFRNELLTAIGGAGKEHNEHDIYLTLGDGYGTMRVQSDSVSFDHLSVPRDLALEIAKVMAKYARASKG